LHLRGLVGRPDGSKILFASAKGLVSGAEAIGHALADDLLGQGAKALLQEFANA
jgi:hydroxymethylbilane synthase